MKLTRLSEFKKPKEDFLTLPVGKEFAARHKLYRRLIKWTQRGRTVLMGIKE